jgi:Peptidase propeptide and YPEB domain
MDRHTPVGRKYRGTRRMSAGIALVAIAAALVARPVSAQGTPQQPPAQQPHEPAYSCSIKVPAGTKDADITRLAKVTEAKAKDAALAAVPGTVVRSEIENENGCGVYSVEIKAADGKVHDVKVDAGTGAVVHQDVGDQAGQEHERKEEDDKEE